MTDDKKQGCCQPAETTPEAFGAALIKLVEGLSDPKAIEAWKDVLNTHYNRPRRSVLADILQDEKSMADVKALTESLTAKMGSNALWHRVFLFLCFATLVAAVVVLSMYGKMDPSSGVILGALAGYLFGRKDG